MTSLDRGPAARGVGQRPGDAVPAQQRVGASGEEGRAAELQGVPQRPVVLGGGQRAVVGDLVVVAPRRARRPRPVVRGSRARNAASTSASKRRFAGSCHSTGPSFGPSASTPGGEEVGQRRLDVAQPLQVGDEAAALDREDEVVGGLRPPRGVRRRALQGVERAVDLDRGQPLGGVLQLAALHAARRVEVAAPPGVHGQPGDAATRVVIPADGSRARGPRSAHAFD